MAAAKKERIVDILEEISAIHSPTGFTHNVLTHIEKMLKKAGIKTRYTNKGALIAGNHAKPEIAVAGHIDTLGLMVREIRGDGQLGFTRLGGPLLPAFEGKTVRIFTAAGKKFSGSLILN